LNSGQMMLSIGGIFFLSLLIINVNTGTGNRITELVSNESVIQATALAEGMFEEIQSRAFDEGTITRSLHKADSLTSPIKLGVDATEINGKSSTFDDIDDFNNHTENYNSSGMGNFGMRVNVYYVQEDKPDAESSVSTFLKRVRIVISNQYLPTKLTFNRLISY
jgi:hypothetical protein